jgi:hypothetical protein
MVTKFSEEHDFSEAEATNPANKYVASRLPRVDYAAKALHDAQRAYYKAHPDENPNDHIWSVEKVDGE